MLHSNTFSPKKIWTWRNYWLKWKTPDMFGFPHQKPPGSEASLMELLGRAGTNVGALVTGAPFFMKRRMDVGGFRSWNGETFGCKSCDHKSYYRNRNDFVFGHYHELGFIVFLCWCLVFAEFLGCIKIFFLHEVGWRYDRMRFVKLWCKLWYDKKDWEEAICGKICLCPAKIDRGPENHLFERGNYLNQTFIFVFHVDFQGYIFFFF